MIDAFLVYIIMKKILLVLTTKVTVVNKQNQHFHIYSKINIIYSKINIISNFIFTYHLSSDSLHSYLHWFFHFGYFLSWILLYVLYFLILFHYVEITFNNWRKNIFTSTVEFNSNCWNSNINEGNDLKNCLNEFKKEPNQSLLQKYST